LTKLDDPQWGQPFTIEELETALGLAADIGLPLSIGEEHEGCDEVLEIPHRVQNLRDGGEMLFMIWKDADGGRFVVQELACPETRTMTTNSLSDALRFCREQRGADWAVVAQ
jgi:hypothetical protein